MRPVIFACALLWAGCGPSGYVHTAEHNEVIGDEHDAQWFTRTIILKGGVEGVELVYCPIQPDSDLVCRTAVVWQVDYNALTDVAPAAAAPPPAPEPAPPTEPVVEENPFDGDTPPEPAPATPPAPAPKAPAPKAPAPAPKG